MKNSRKLLSAISVTLCMSILLSSEMAICADAIDVTKTNLPDCNDGIVSVIEEMNNSDEQDSKIIGEIEDERSEYIKRFKLNNGATMAVQYSMPVHYKDAEGKWVEYNNSLISTTDNGDEVFDNYDSNVDIKLSKKAKENNMIKVKSSEYAVSWGFVGVDKVKGTVMLRDTNDSLTENEKLTMPKNATSEVVYYDVYDDVDLQYILSSLGIKENIILKSSNTQRNFEVKYKVNNLEAKQIDDKTITLYDKKENPIYTINAPFMTDADGDMCNNVSIAIQNQKGSNLTVKISVDDKFFDENCHYPVVIDPMFYTNQNWNDGIQCTFADSSQPNQNFAYGGPDGYTGTIYTGSFGQGVYRSFIKLNTLPTLNAGDMIVDARLNLHLYDSDFYKDVYINAYEITSGWNQTTLTWNNQPTCNNTVLDYIKLGQSSAIDLVSVGYYQYS